MAKDCTNRIANRMKPAVLWRQITPNRRDESSPIRWALVNQVRAEIAAGTYDTPQNLAAALERMSLSLMA